MDANAYGIELLLLLRGHGDGLLADGWWLGRQGQGEVVEASDTERTKPDGGGGNSDGSSNESNATECQCDFDGALLSICVILRM